MMVVDVNIVSCDGQRALGDVTYELENEVKTARLEAYRVGRSLSFTTEPGTPLFLLALDDVRSEFQESLDYQRDLLREKN